MDMKAQRFSVEVELTAIDSQGHKRKSMSDASITPQRKSGRQTVSASDEIYCGFAPSLISAISGAMACWSVKSTSCP